MKTTINNKANLFIFTFTILTLIIALDACKNETASPAPTQPPAQNVNLTITLPANLAKPLAMPENDTLFDLALWNDNGFQLRFGTKRLFPCLNYEVINYVTLNNNTIQLYFSKIPEVTFCFTSVGAARANLPINNLSVGIYPVQIILSDTLLLQNLSRDKVSKLINKSVAGNLIVNQQFYELQLPEQSLIKLVQRRILR